MTEQEELKIECLQIIAEGWKLIAKNGGSDITFKKKDGKDKIKRPVKFQ